MKYPKDMDVLNKIDAFYREHKNTISVIVIACLGITAFAFIPSFFGLKLREGGDAGRLGSFLNGYVGSIFLVISVAVLFETYKNQRATNHRNYIESRFFELLRYHRENVADLGIDDGKLGQRVFVSMVREFRDVRKIVNQEAPDYPRGQKLDLAYRAFYYGVGPNSTRILKAAVEKNHPSDLVKRVTDRLDKIQSQYRDLEEELYAGGGSEDSIRFQIRNEWSKTKLTTISYRPFDGHQSRLGHYYRHLYQTAKYIKQHGGDNATDYAGVLRAQLSNHEQALLALNALSELGKNWRIEKLIDGDFALIKNIPNALFPAEMVNIKDAFPDIIFEYELADIGGENTNRNAVESITII